MVFTTNKPLFFDPYTVNKHTGAFILIDPITNNTSAVGMILGAVSPEHERRTEKGTVISVTGDRLREAEAVRRLAAALSDEGHTVIVVGQNVEGAYRIDADTADIEAAVADITDKI